MKRIGIVLLFLLLIFTSVGPLFFQKKLTSVYGKTVSKSNSLYFIKNGGQIRDQSVKYYVELKNGYAFFSEKYFGFAVYKDGKVFVYRIYLDAQLKVENKATASHNFLLGKNKYLNIPSFKTLYYKGDGYIINFLLEEKFKWNIRASDISKIRLRYSVGDGKLMIDKNRLVMVWNEGKIVEEIPHSYHNGKRIKIEYKSLGSNYVGFDGEVTKNVLIDPSTFLGGSEDDIIYSIYKYNDYIYAAGYTKSSNFPTTPGAYTINYKGNQDGFISKFYKDLSTLVSSTYLGGSDEDGVNSVFVNGDGVFLTGYTKSSDFPITSGVKKSGEDVFVTKLNHNLTTVEASRIIGGNNNDRGISIFIANGYVYIIGDTYSTDFPTTPGAYDGSYNGIPGPWGMDTFISKFDLNLSTLVASTYLGGSSYDASYPIYVTDTSIYVGGYTYSTDFPKTSGAYDESHNGGYDAFISKFNLDLTNLEASTFLGGNSHDYIFNLKVYNGNVFACGGTYSTNFPTTPGAYDGSYNGSATSWGFGGDGFVSSLDSDLTSLIASTYLGGASDDHLSSIFVSGDSIFVTGRSWSTDFPTTPEAYDTSQNGGEDVVISKLDLNLTNLKNSTFLGGSNDDRGASIFVDGKVYVAGYTYSSDFPTTSGAYDRSYNGGSNPGANNYNNYGGGDGFIATLDSKLQNINPIKVGGRLLPVNRFALISLFTLLYILLPFSLIYLILKFKHLLKKE